MQINYRVSLAFDKYSDADLDEFTSNIIACLTGNAAFPNPPVPPALLTALADVPVSDLTSLQSVFQKTIAAAAQGGKQETALKDEAREPLVYSLRNDAAYVQSLASQSLSTLLSSGYAANSINRAQSPLDTPVIVLADNLGTTKVLLRLQPVVNAKSYDVRVSMAANVWADMGTFTQARRIVVEKLTPGTTYTFQVRAVGGSTGYSDWSTPVSIMAT